MDEQVPGRGAVVRARADAQRGDLRLARQRLRGYLESRSADLDARRLLADLYRRDGYRDEAGRWGYLERSAASDDERALYERACAARLTADWRHTYILKGLRWTSRLTDAPLEVADVLRELTVRAEQERLDWAWRATPLHKRLVIRRRASAISARRSR